MENLKGACIIGQSGGAHGVINASAQGVIQTALASPDHPGSGGRPWHQRGLGRPALRHGTGRPRSAGAAPVYPPPRWGLAGTSWLTRMWTTRTINGSWKSSKNTTSATSFTTAETTPWIPATKSANTCSGWATCNIIGVPKTIDNDLSGTDHCPGYASAAKHRHLLHGALPGRPGL